MVAVAFVSFRPLTCPKHTTASLPIKTDDHTVLHCKVFCLSFVHRIPQCSDALALYDLHLHTDRAKRVTMHPQMQSHGLTLLLWGLVLSSPTARHAASATATAATEPAASEPSDPGVAAAAARAGATSDALQAAAELTGRTSRQLQEQLARDHSARVTSSGAVVYACNLCCHGQCQRDASAVLADTAGTDTASAGFAAAAVGDDGSVTTAGVTEDSDVALGDAFKLHSMPSARRKIFLQFQGCVTQVGGFSCMHLQPHM